MLQVHLLNHPECDYDFDFDSSGKSGYQIAVSRRLDSPSPRLGPCVYQLGKPLEPFDLDKYIAGDESWITDRLGPQNDLRQKLHVVRAPQKLLNRRKDKRVVVPRTRQPLFNPLSKVPLQPGTEVRPQVADDAWLIQKHRDTLQDFVDVEVEEKEYMMEWDSFIFKRRLSSDQYLPRELLAFLREKGPWLAAKKARMLEFGKHLSVLIARGALDDSVINDILNRVNEVRGLKQPEQLPQPAKEEDCFKNSGGCAVCGRSVLGPMLLVCSNTACMKRLYHDDCVRATAKMPVESSSWLCNACLP